MKVMPAQAQQLLWGVMVDLGSAELLCDLQQHPCFQLSPASIMVDGEARCALEECIVRKRNAIIQRVCQESKLAPCVAELKMPPLLTAVQAAVPTMPLKMLASTCHRYRNAKQGVHEVMNGTTALLWVLKQAKGANDAADFEQHMTAALVLLDETYTPLDHKLQYGKASGTVPFYAATKLSDLRVLDRILEHQQHVAQQHGDPSLATIVLNTLCQGSTALYRVLYDDIAGKKQTVVRLLLQAGADPTVASYELQKLTSALHLVIARHDYHMTKMLLGAKALKACDIATKLSACCDYRGFTPLHAAVQGGRVDVFELLLAKAGAHAIHARPAPPNAKDLPPPSPLLLAVQMSAVDSSGAASDILEAILRERQWTQEALCSAMWEGMSASDESLMATWLLRHRSLTIDPIMQGGDREVHSLTQLLLNKANWPLLSLLSQESGFTLSGQQLHNLMAAGCNMTTWHHVVEAPRIAIDAKDAAGNFLLHQAVLQGKPELCALLIRKGARAIAQNRDGKTALHLAVKATNERKVLVESLLTAAADMAVVSDMLEATDSNGQTPLQCCPSAAVKVILKQYDAPGNTDDEEAQPTARQKQRQEQSAQQQPVEADETSWSDEEWDESQGPKPLVRPGETLPIRTIHLQEMLHKVPALVASLRQVAAVRTAANELDAASEGVAARMTAGEDARLARQVAHAIQTHQSTNDANPMAAAAAAAAAAAPELAQALEAVEPEEQEGALEAAAMTHDQIIETLKDLPWEFIINRDARQEWSGMDWPLRKMVAKKLAQIGLGRWQEAGDTERLNFSAATKCSDLELWRTKWSKSGRIVFEVAVDWSETAQCYCEMLRLWAITTQHNRYIACQPKILDSHRKSAEVRNKLNLQAVSTARVPDASRDAGQRLPRQYTPLEESDIAAARAAALATAEEPAEQVLDLRKHCPPAAAGQDSYTLLKFYNLSSSLLTSIFQGMKDDEVDFPFRVSPTEQRIIELISPSSIILLGRSGTGKTTCAVFRMFGAWLAHHTSPDESSYNMVFLTASATLRQQVAASFHKLQKAAIGAEEARRLTEAATSADLHTLRDVPPECFPLFLSTRRWLHLLDGTLEDPFFPRLPNGALKYAVTDDYDPDGMSMAINMTINYDDEELDEDDESVSDDGGEDGGPSSAMTSAAQRTELTYQYFLNNMWSAIKKGSKANLKPALVFQEIFSYIKGSGEAVSKADGASALSKEEYLELGRKRAPNFSGTTRKLVYPLYVEYEKVKKQHRRYDTMDLVSSIYRRLTEQGYQGTPIHALFRDEVQDFTQAELLADLRVVPVNNLFYCGDTSQTISRGIGFRFADIITLFYEEQQRRQAIGGVLNEPQHRVVVPKLEFLKTNYRTHTGIMDVAATVVDLLHRFFPQHMDKLARETAFFDGPGPLLLNSLEPDDLAILLSGSDAQSSQVEFGAHQAVLVRTQESKSRLPKILQDSNALTMTVPQAKGLEFDDVFLLNFFSDSPAHNEWRVLMTYLEELEDMEASGQTLPGGRQLVDLGASEEGGVLRPLPFDESQHALLSEELKHLYTAITRAKNNVILFDDCIAKRAPFFHLLRRLGLVRVVVSLLKDGTDASKFGLSQERSSKEEWMKRGDNLMENRRHELAAKAYTSAGDAVRAAYAQARWLYGVAQELAADPASEARGHDTFHESAYLFVAAATRAAQGPRHVTPEVRQQWLRLAARALVQAGSDCVRSGVQLAMDLGDYAFAWKGLGRIADLREKAALARKAADQLRASGNSREAGRWVAKAARCFRSAGQYAECMALFDRHNAAIGSHITSAEVDTIAGVAFMAAMQAGDRKQALAASKQIKDPEQRQARLREGGFLTELAEELKDPAEAAELFASQGLITAALQRLQGAPQTPETNSLMAMYRMRIAQDCIHLGKWDQALEHLASAKAAAANATPRGLNMQKGQLALLQAVALLGANSEASKSEASTMPGTLPLSALEEAVQHFVLAGDLCGPLSAVALLTRSLEVAPAEDSLAVVLGLMEPLESSSTRTSNEARLHEVNTMQITIGRIIQQIVHGSADTNTQPALEGASAFFGLRHSRGTLATDASPSARCDNVFLTAALKRAGLYGRQDAACKTAMSNGARDVPLDAATVRATITLQLLTDLAEVSRFLATLVLLPLPDLQAAPIAHAAENGKEAEQKQELLLEALSFAERTLDFVNKSATLLRHHSSTDELWHQLQNAVGAHCCTLCIGVAAASFPAFLAQKCVSTFVTKFAATAQQHQCHTYDEAIQQSVLQLFTCKDPVSRLSDQNTAYFVWRTLTVLLHAHAPSLKASRWSSALAKMSHDLRVSQLPREVAVMEFQGKVLHFNTYLTNAQALFLDRCSIDGCNAIMSFVELCRVGELSSAAEPLAFEAYVELLEPVAALLVVYLTPSRGGQSLYLAAPLLDILTYSPVLGQHTHRFTIANLQGNAEREENSTFKVPELCQRFAAVVYSLTKELSAEASSRPPLLAAVQPHLPRDGNADAHDADWRLQQQQCAARLAVLAATVAVALGFTRNARIPGLNSFRSHATLLMAVAAANQHVPHEALKQALAGIVDAETGGRALARLLNAVHCLGTDLMQVGTNGNVKRNQTRLPDHLVMAKLTPLRKQASSEPHPLPALDTLMSTADDVETARREAEETVARTAAASACQAVWRASRLRLRQLRAGATLRAFARSRPYLRANAKRWVAGLRYRTLSWLPQKDAQDLEEARAKAAAAAPEERLDWVFELLQKEEMRASQCPVCPPSSSSNSRGDLPEDSELETLKVGINLNHRQCEDHMQGEEAFHRYYDVYHEAAVPALRDHDVAVLKVMEQLEKAEAAASDPELLYAGKDLSSGFSLLYANLLDEMASIEGSCEWGNGTVAIQEAAQKLTGHCNMASSWLQRAAAANVFEEVTHKGRAPKRTRPSKPYMSPTKMHPGSVVAAAANHLHSDTDEEDLDMEDDEDFAFHCANMRKKKDKRGRGKFGQGTYAY